MASLRTVVLKDGTESYHVLFRHNGRQCAVVFRRADHAEVLKAAINVHGPVRACEMHGLDPEPRRKNRPPAAITVAQWLRQHIDQLTGVEQYTIDKYESYLANDIAPMLGDIPLPELSEGDIARWVKHLETSGGRSGQGNSAKTIRNKYGFLSGALGGAVGKHLPANPCAGRRLPRNKGTDDHDKRMLSRDEFRALLAATPDHWKPLIKFLAASGTRWGEASALQPKHVDVAAGTIKIRQAWKKSSLGYTLGPPKTKRSRRTVDVPSKILAELDLSNEFVFTNSAGNPARYPAFKRHVWDRAVADAGLDPKPTPHDLRHTYASWQLNGGTPMTVVSRQLGHESIQITVDIYGDLDRVATRAAAELIDDLLG